MFGGGVFLHVMRTVLRPTLRRSVRRCTTLVTDRFALLKHEVGHCFTAETCPSFKLTHFTTCRLHAWARFALDEQLLHQTYKGLMVRIISLQYLRMESICFLELTPVTCMLTNMLQAEAHPDRTVRRMHPNSRPLLTRLRRLRHAILKQPHLRATHLLELHGLPLNEETGGEVVGMDFLMDIMEVREELEEANNDPETLRTLRDANQQAMSELLEQLAAAFDDDANSDLERARALTARLQYLHKIEEEIRARTEVT